MKKTALMLGIAGSLIGCSTKHEKRSSKLPLPNGAAGRIIAADSANDRVIIDTSAIAITRNVKKTPCFQITGLFSQNLRPKKGDILFFTLDTNSVSFDQKTLETFRLFSYHMN